MRAWLIRAGEGAVELDSMRHTGVIAVRYKSVGDVAVWTASQIKQGLCEEGRTAAAGQLRARIQCSHTMSQSAIWSSRRTLPIAEAEPRRRFSSSHANCEASPNSG